VSWGSFLSGIPASLGLGKVQFEGDRFICEPYGLEGASDTPCSAVGELYMRRTS